MVFNIIENFNHFSGIYLAKNLANFPILISGHKKTALVMGESHKQVCTYELAP